MFVDLELTCSTSSIEVFAISFEQVKKKIGERWSRSTLPRYDERNNVMIDKRVGYISIEKGCGSTSTARTCTSICVYILLCNFTTHVTLLQQILFPVDYIFYNPKVSEFLVANMSENLLPVLLEKIVGIALCSIEFYFVYCSSYFTNISNNDTLK